MTYINTARAALVNELPNEDASLVDLYLLLALCKGSATSAADVHDAWAIWRSRTRPDHPAILPFDALHPDTQRLDDDYVDAIRRAVEVLGL